MWCNSTVNGNGGESALRAVRPPYKWPKPLATKSGEKVTIHRNRDLSSVSEHQYRRGHAQTQGANYFEIIQSGAWAKWTKGVSNSELFNPSKINKTIANSICLHNRCKV